MSEEQDTFYGNYVDESAHDAWGNVIGLRLEKVEEVEHAYHTRFIRFTFEGGKLVILEAQGDELDQGIGVYRECDYCEFRGAKPRAGTYACPYCGEIICKDCLLMHKEEEQFK